MHFFVLQIGMAKPAARRLLDVVKKKRRKQIVSKLLPGNFGKLGTLTRKRNQNHQDAATGPLALTCLIQAKDVALSDKLGQGFKEVSVNYRIRLTVSKMNVVSQVKSTMELKSI